MLKNLNLLTLNAETYSIQPYTGWVGRGGAFLLGMPDVLGAALVVTRGWYQWTRRLINTLFLSGLNRLLVQQRMCGVCVAED